jgi:hypothetical protein
VALSALSFGLLGWGAAHAITNAVLGHNHLDGSRQVHGYTGPLLVAGAALALTSLVAVFLAALTESIGRGQRGQRLGTTAAPARGRGARIRNAAALSAVAYVTSEFGEHLIFGDHGLPPTFVLLTGLAVYLVAGIGTSLLWHASIRAARSAGVRVGRLLAQPASGGRRTVVGGIAPRGLRRACWVRPAQGRGPPLLSA